MTLTDDQIIQYQALYKNRFGRDITQDEAREKGTKLLYLIRNIYKPMTQKEYQALQDRKKGEKG